MAEAGRPTLYTPELAEEICARMAGGESLRKICEDEEMPNRATVRNWVIDDREGFFSQYARARKTQALEWAEDILEIADDGVRDTYVDEDGNVRTNTDVLGRSRLRVDTRKWLLSKVLPKVYGDKVTLAGDSDAPIEIKVTRTIVKPDADG